MNNLVPDFIVSSLLLHLPEILTGVVVLFVFFVFQRQTGYRHRLGAITNQKNPPSHLSIAEMGTLMDGVVHQRDLTALFLEFAVKGYLVIEETQSSRFWHTGEYVLHQKKDADLSQLHPYEHEILSIIFKQKSTITIQKAGKVLANHLEQIETGIFEHLVRKGYYKTIPSVYRKQRILISLFFLCLFLFAGFFHVMQRESITMMFWISFGIMFFSLLFYLLKSKALTKKGIQAHHHLLGYKDYLITCQENQLTEELFQKNIPAVFMLDITQAWAQKSQIELTPPIWFLPDKEQKNMTGVTFVSHIESFANKFQFSVFGKSNSFDSLSKYILQKGFSEDEYTNNQ